MVEKIWNKILILAQNEPLLRNLIISSVAVLTGFGINVGDDQTQQIIKLAAALAAIILLVSTRQEVTPTRKVDAKIQDAIGDAVPKDVVETKIDQAYNAIPGVDKKPTLENHV